ncbi:hypothetical protein ACO0QE_000711 [Hanseniaspora vineae]
MKSGCSLYRDDDVVNCGEVFRYKIKVSNCVENTEVPFSFKNEESIFLRPVYITGPFSLYVDCRPYQYDEDEEFSENIQFDADVRPEQQFQGVLNCNKNSWNGECYEWTIDVISQVAINPNCTLRYSLELLGHSDLEIPSLLVDVTKESTSDLWSYLPLNPENEVHLVVLTHGIFSNIGADMLYLRDKLLKRGHEKNLNLLIRGCMDNVGKSHKGIEYLGTRVADYFVDLVERETKRYNITKVSFIGHSLGGPVQAFAIAHVYEQYPEIFERIKPVNFVIMASPMLGVAAEMPAYASMALDLGGLGKTGRDLTFKHRHFFGRPNSQSNKPTLYANVLNDGIVPLRTSALLYLDWHTIDKLLVIFAENGLNKDNESKHGDGHTSSEIPELNAKSTQTLAASGTTETSSESEMNNEQDCNDNDADLIKQKKLSKFSRIQIKNDSESSENEISDQSTQAEGEIQKQSESFNPPPKASALLSAAQFMFAPLPTEKYIISPSSRTADIILHDKIYSPSQLPAPHYVHRKTIKKIIYPKDKVHRKEERVARYWQEKMDWRKVLVVLQPDSHNSIVVRRRFVNLYGNVVVKNLVETHF